MTSIFVGHPLAGKNVAEVALAIRANDLYPTTICICMLVYCSGDLVIKTRPSAAGGKLILRFVQRLIALSADVCARHFVVIILAGKWTFRAFAKDNTSFVVGKRVVCHNDTNEMISIGKRLIEGIGLEKAKSKGQIVL